MQRIEFIRMLKANSNIILRDGKERLTPAGSTNLFNVTNYSAKKTFSIYQTSSIFFENERAD